MSFLKESRPSLRVNPTNRYAKDLPVLQSTSRKLTCVFILASLASWGLVASSAAAAAELYADRIAAVVNGDVILVSDIEKNLNPVIRNFNNIGLNIIPPGKSPSHKEVLDELVVTRLLEQEAQRKGLKMDEAALEAAIDAIRNRNKLTKDQFALYLALNGLSYGDYRDIMKRRLTLERLIAMEVDRKVPLSEADAQRYFKENADKIEDEFKELLKKFSPPKQPEKEDKPDIPTHRKVWVGGKVRLYRITLKIPPNADNKTKKGIGEKAVRIYREAVTGADFAELAKKHSEDDLAKSGGDLGYMNYDGLVPQMQNIVQNMEKGRVSPPVGSAGALFIFYLADATGRQEKQTPIPEEERKHLLKQWEEAQRQRGDRPDRNGQAPAGPEEPSETSTGTKETPTKNLGILNPDEEKRYRKVRHKVYAVLRMEKRLARQKEWIDELKKNSIIETKL